MIEALASGELCPGLVPVFGALRLLSRMRILGGFRQVCYLESIASAWLDAGVVAQDDGVPGALLTGRLTTETNEAVYPLDLALGAAEHGEVPGPDTPMGAWWEPLLPRVKATT